MKLIAFLLIYSIVYIPVAVASYLIFEPLGFLVFNSLGLISWFIGLFYIDKVLLLFLGAREVIDTDEHHFFQILKNNAYKNRVHVPKVYLYDGNLENCFLFESFSSWTIVLDKRLLERLNDESMEKLVEFFYRYHIKEGKGFLKTKAMGVSVVFYLSIYWLLKNLFLHKTKSRFFKAFAGFVIIMTRPFMYPFEFILKINSRVPVDITLQQYSLRVEAQDTFSDYLLGLIIENKRFNEMIIQYMEGYPLFLECEFKHEF